MGTGTESAPSSRPRPGFVAPRPRALRRLRALGDVAGDPARRRALPRTARGRVRRGRRGRPSPARLGVLARRAPARSTPPRRSPTRTRSGPRRRRRRTSRAGCSGCRTGRSRAAFGNVWAYDLIVLLSFLARGRLRLLVAAGARALAPGGARRRRRLLPHAVPRRAVDGAPARADLVPPAGARCSRSSAAGSSSPRSCLCARSRSPASSTSRSARSPSRSATRGRGLPRADWWKAGVGAVGAVAAGLVVERWTIAGSIGVGRSFAQVERYSAELSDFVTRGVGSGVEELVFVGWLTPARRARRAVGGTGPTRARGPARPCGARPVLCSRWARTCPATRRSGAPCPASTRRASRSACMPIACLALAALVAFGGRAGADNACVTSTQARPAGRRRGRARAARGRPAGAGVRRGRGGRAKRAPTRRSAAKAACSSCRCSGRTCTSAARTSATRARARASGRRGTRRSRRERRAGSRASFAASRAVAARFPRRLGIRFVAVHRGLYDASGFFAPSCAARAEARAASQPAGACSPATGRSPSSPEAEGGPPAGGPPPRSLPHESDGVRVVTLGPSDLPADHPEAASSSISRCERPSRSEPFDRRPEVELVLRSLSLRSMSQTPSCRSSRTGGIAVLRRRALDPASGRHPHRRRDQR